jgi:hypothetical protein
MNGRTFTDRLEPVGIAAGGLLVLIALGTLVGMPWTTGNSAVASVLQMLGVVVLVVLGAGLAWLSYVRD